MSNVVDNDLVIQTLAGNVEAFGELYERHSDLVYRFILSRTRDEELACDLTQDTFLGAFQSLSRFRAGSSFQAWLVGIARNVLMDYLRQHYRWTEKLPALVREFIDLDSPFSPQDVLESLDAKQLVQQIMAELTPRYQSIIKMRLVQGMSRAEVATTLFGSDTDENRRKASVLLYRAMTAARKAAKRIQDLEGESA